MNIEKFLKNKQKAPYKIIAKELDTDEPTIALYHNKNRAEFCLWRFLKNGYSAELFINN